MVKLPLQRWRTLRWCVPYALEGWLRREIDAGGASLQDVAHGMEVTLVFSVPDDSLAAWLLRINDASQGRVRWLADEPGVG